MIIQTRAYARAGLIGNPSDGYNGKTISIILRNFHAQVICYESPRIAIHPLQRDQMEFSSLEALVQDVQQYGYYGGLRLIKASIKCFYDYCRANGIHLDNRNFTIEYGTNIPVRVGLAGSSAIVAATMKAMMTFYGIDIPKPVLPGVILSVELDELGIGAGLQDRVIQVYEGVVFMDFDKHLMEKQGHGDYVPLPPKSLPPVFVAYHDNLAEGTEVTHNDLRSRFNRGDKEVLAGMKQFAAYAEEARSLLVAGRGSEIAPLMNANFELRSKLCQISAGNRELVETGRKLGAAAKFAGSGGAVIGVYDGDPGRLQRLRDAYGKIGASLILPQIEESDS